ncbi:MAG: GNAT family N-acetyltransferase [Acidobacteria bacterium]|nr:GNAT family N-acetyltransferase [Acidobacteriota bacterium]
MTTELQNQIKIVPFEDRFAADFDRLNRAWLEGYDLLEPADLKHLESPRETFITPGGAILVALDQETVIGTCAIHPIDATSVEIAKLAVDPFAQGRGLGRQLMVAAIQFARFIGAKKIILVSNKKLAAAIRLYESLGFQHQPLPEDTEYATADVYMELDLSTLQ